MNADGTNPIQHTAITSPDFDTDARFSRDGNKIVFSRRVAGKTRIHTMTKDGTGVIALPGSPNGADINPDWK